MQSRDALRPISRERKYFDEFLLNSQTIRILSIYFTVQVIQLWLTFFYFSVETETKSYTHASWIFKLLLISLIENMHFKFYRVASLSQKIKLLIKWLETVSSNLSVWNLKILYVIFLWTYLLFTYLLLCHHFKTSYKI